MSFKFNPKIKLDPRQISDRRGMPSAVYQLLSGNAARRSSDASSSYFNGLTEAQKRAVMRRMSRKGHN